LGTAHQEEWNLFGGTVDVHNLTVPDSDAHPMLHVKYWGGGCKNVKWNLDYFMEVYRRIMVLVSTDLKNGESY
jgi:hypothetical protein